jgi:hypothetical protein
MFHWFEVRSASKGFCVVPLLALRAPIREKYAMQTANTKSVQPSRCVAGWTAIVVGLVLLSCRTTTVAAERRAFAAAAAAAPAIAAQQQQLRSQLEPLLTVELSFANRVCKLSDLERRTLISKSNAWLDTVILDLAKQGAQPQQVGVWIAGRGAAQPMRDPRESVENSVAKIVKSELPKQKAAIYEEECRKRTEFQRQVAIENLVARMDSELKLAPKQRNQLAESLTEHWDKSWAPQIEMFVHGMDIWPNVPDQWVRPHLTAAQQLAWGRLNKQSGQIFFGGNPFGDGQVIDDIDLSGAPEQYVGEGAKQPVDAANAAAN